MVFPKLLAIEAVEPYIIFLHYDDNTSGEVDLSDLKGRGVFKWWDEDDNFKEVFLDKETGAIVWNDKIDIDPDALYLKLKEISFEDWIAIKNSHAQTV